jgi:uncharacterized protein YegP (UPF0339 family)
MGYSKYQDLVIEPPKLKVVTDPREIQIEVISCMCDNKHDFSLKKNENGEFKFRTSNQAYTNFGIKHKQYEIEWKADEGKWRTVFKMINTGSIKISKITSR